MRLTALALLAFSLHAQTTTVTVSSPVVVSGINRSGVVLDYPEPFGAGQIMKNFAFLNPGFEGYTTNIVMPCTASTGATDCQATGGGSAYFYSFWPTGWFTGATYQLLRNGAQVASGTITTSTGGSTYPTPNSVTDFTLSGSPGVITTDWMLVHLQHQGFDYPGAYPNVNANSTGWLTTPVLGWWINTGPYAATGTCVPALPVQSPCTYAETSDIHAGSIGTQALDINTAGTGSVGVAAKMDSISGQSFMQFNGSYAIRFWAKSISGSTTAMTIDVDRNLGGTVLTTQTPTLTTSWAQYTLTFTASEVGVTGTAEVNFQVTNAEVRLDEVELYQTSTDPTNTTNFRDGVVNALKALKLGTIRMYGYPGQLGGTIDNTLTPLMGRENEQFLLNFTLWGEDYGLTDFLALCQLTGANPWYVLPSTVSPADMTNLMEYLGGACGTTYGAKRCAAGYSTPWTSVFSKIYFEHGNENWNNGFWAGGFGDDTAYGQRASVNFTAAKASMYYSSKFTMIAGAQYVSAGRAAAIVAACTACDSIAEAPYLVYQFQAGVSDPFGALYQEIYNNATGSGAGGNTTLKQDVTSASPLPVTLYESNIGPLVGTATQTEINNFIPAVGTGVGVADSTLLYAQQLGVNVQNIFQFAQWQDAVNGWNVPMWGISPFSDTTAIVRPTYLGAQLINTAIGTSPTNMVTTVQSGLNPTWTQTFDYYGTGISGTAPEIGSYAFSNGAVVVVNRSRTTPRAVNFSGSSLSGNVTQLQLTSSNITDNNESSAVVATTTTNLTSFNQATPLTLPPFSLTAFIPAGGVPPIISSVGSSSITTTGATITWTTNTAASSQVEYGLTSGYGSTTTLDPTLVTSHSQNITGLTPNTTYHYAALSVNSGGSAASGDFTFTTLPTQLILTSLTAEYITATSIRVCWTASTNTTQQVKFDVTSANPSVNGYARETSGQQSFYGSAPCINVTGLTPSTSYTVCPDAQNASALATNCTSAGDAGSRLIVSTIADTSNTPTLPTITLNTKIPATFTCTTTTSCANLQTDLNTAQTCSGEALVLVPTSPVCTAGGNLGVSLLAINNRTDTSHWTYVAPVGYTSTLPAPGTRITDAYRSAMYQLTAVNGSYLMSGSGAGPINMHFIGALIKPQALNTSGTISPTAQTRALLAFDSGTGGLIFDRSIVDGLGYPEQPGGDAVSLAWGNNIGWINSRIENEYRWFPYINPVTPTTTATPTASMHFGAMTVGRGDGGYNFPSGFTVAITSGTGTYQVYVAIGGAVHFLPSASAGTVTCTTCTADTAGGSVPSTGYIIATGAFSSGQFTSVTISAVNTSAEGTNCFDFSSQNSNGLVWTNNEIDCNGIGILTNSFNSTGAVQNILIQGNTFDSPVGLVSSTNTTAPFIADRRSHIECKICESVLIDGNYFNNNFSGVGGNGSQAVALKSDFAGGGSAHTRNVTVSNNFITGGANCFYVSGGNVAYLTSNTPQTRLTGTVKYYNNVCQTDSYVNTQYWLTGITGGSTLGTFLWIDQGSEKVTADHNTWYEAGGTQPNMFWQTDQWSADITLTNNILIYHADSQGGIRAAAQAGLAQTPALLSGQGTTPMNGAWQRYNGTSTPAWTFTGNLTLAGCLNSQTCTDATTSGSLVTDQSASYPSGNQWGLIGTATWGARQDNVGWTNRSTLYLKLAVTSPYYSTNPGVFWGPLIVALNGNTPTVVYTGGASVTGGVR